MSPQADPVTLPSEDMYDELDKKGGQPCLEGSRQEDYGRNLNDRIGPEIRKQGIKEENFASKITKAWCRAYKMWEVGEPSGLIPWHFFYYWLGEKIKGPLGNHDFHAAMKTIYSKLPEDKHGSGYTNIYPDISWDIFIRRKKLHDYDYDFKILGLSQQAQESREADSCPWKSKLDEERREAEKAYKELITMCEGDTTSNTYCADFKKDTKGDVQYAEPQELECAPEALRRTRLTEDCQKKKLPSERVYCELNKATNSCNGNIQTAGMKSALETYPNTEKCAEQIVNGWCSAFKKDNNIMPEGERCNYLYYWTGDTLSGMLVNDNKFPDVMSAVYDKLISLGISNGCTNIYEGISQQIFTRMKVLFDFSKDCPTGQSQLRSDEYSCGDSEDDYLDGMCSACRYMFTDCTGGEGHSDKSYCTGYENKYKQYCEGDKLSKLACTDLVDDVSGGEGKGGSDGGGSHRKEGEEADVLRGIVPVAVPGGLAAIGLPALAYFFYKYKSHLFFLKGNNSSSGGSRSKRSSIRREFNDFDDHYEDDVTSIEGFSTLGSSEYSIPYTSSSR